MTFAMVAPIPPSGRDRRANHFNLMISSTVVVKMLTGTVWPVKLSKQTSRTWTQGLFLSYLRTSE